MSTIDTTSQTTLQSLGLTQPQSNTNNAQLSQDEFLKLMITQLNNQDPMKPMQNGEFLSQMAQFGTVSGINNLQQSFSQLATSLTSSQALQASSLVGRNVLVPGSVGVLNAGQTMQGTIKLPASTSDVVLNVYDAGGQLVRRVDLGAHSQGDMQFSWDGLTDGGAYAPPGQYTVKAEMQLDGQTVAADTALTATVDSVTLGGAGQGLTLNLAGLGSVPLSQVQQIM